MMRRSRLYVDPMVKRTAGTAHTGEIPQARDSLIGTRLWHNDIS